MEHQTPFHYQEKKIESLADQFAAVGMTMVVRVQRVVERKKSKEERETSGRLHVEEKETEGSGE